MYFADFEKRPGFQQNTYELHTVFCSVRISNDGTLPVIAASRATPDANNWVLALLFRDHP